MLDLSQFFLQSREIGFVTDPRGTILLVTGGTEQALGRPAEEFKGKNLADLAEGGEIRDFFSRESAEPAHMYVGLRLRDREGKLLNLHAAAFSLVSPSGEIQGWFIGVRDMPGVAEDMRRNPVILGALVDSVGASIWSFDVGGTILACGGACCDYFGYTREESEGKLEASRLFADPGKLREILERVDLHGSFEGEVLLASHGGEERLNHVLIKRLPADLGKPLICYTCVSFDISQQQRAEEFYRVLFEKASFGIMMIDGETLEVTAANERAGHLLGYEREELLTKPILSLHPDFEVEKARHVLKEVELKGEGDFEGLWCLRKDGRAFPADLSVSRVTVGGRRSFLGVFRDVTNRVRTAAELKEAQIFLERFRDQASISIALFDTSGGFIYVNDQACRLLGRPRKELLGSTFIATAPPDVLAQQQENFALVMTGERMRFRTEVMHPDGKRIHVEIYAAPLIVGGQRYVSCIGRDITEEVRGEEALRASEARWRSLVQHAPDIILTVDWDGKILSINRTVPGIDLKDVIGTSYYDYIYPDDRAIAKSALEWVSQAGQPSSFELRGTGPYGRLRWYASRINPVLQGDEVTGATIIATDITEQREAQEELRFQKTLLESQTEAARDGILVVGTENKMISFNRRFVEMWGIPADIVERRSDEDAIRSVLGKLVNPKKFVQRVKELYANPDEQSRDELVLKDGRTFDRYSAPVRGTDGTHYGRVWYFSDVTEQKRAEAEIRKAYEDLKGAQAQVVRSEKLASVGMLVSGVAHEINNPLSVIYGNLCLLAEDSKGVFGVRKRREMVRDALKAAERARRIVEEFRHFARDTRTKELVDVNRCLQEALAVAKREFGPGIRVTKRLGRIPPVSGFSGQMNQVFFNLLKNAGEAIPRRGTITLRSRVRAGNAVIEVADTGRGMKPSVRRRLFDPFFTTKPEGKGLGLGLAVSAMIVQNHDGRLTVRSRPGKGSVFRVEIPLEKKPR